MKRMGRKNRPFYRVCAVDTRTKRDGRVIEELGYYDPLVMDTHARAILKSSRIDYWLSVGAQPSVQCNVLIKKYGTNGSHLALQQAALAKLKSRRKDRQSTAAQFVYVPAKKPPKPEPVAETAAEGGDAS
jgi:small subunit ribosomal protein S16